MSTEILKYIDKHEENFYNLELVKPLNLERLKCTMLKTFAWQNLPKTKHSPNQRETCS